jgi:thiol-disulfide isomerase/thioredoxin
MRRLSAVRRAVWIASTCALAVAAAAVAADRVRLPGLRGGELTSADLERGATVVVVWAAWSPKCRDIVERVNALEASLGGSARVVTVDFQEEPADVEAFLRGKGLKAPVYLDKDGEYSKALEVTFLPGLVVYRDGAVKFRGKMPADAGETVAAALR